MYQLVGGVKAAKGVLGGAPGGLLDPPGQVVLRLARREVAQEQRGVAQHGGEQAIYDSASTPRGCSLPQVAELSKVVGLNYQMAFRQTGAAFTT